MCIVLKKYVYVSAYIPGAMQGSYYKRNGATDNSVYTYMHNSQLLVIPEMLIGTWFAMTSILFVYAFYGLEGKPINCLSVTCRNSCSFQRMLEPHEFLPPSHLGSCWTIWHHTSHLIGGDLVGYIGFQVLRQPACL